MQNVSAHVEVSLEWELQEASQRANDTRGRQQRSSTIDLANNWSVGGRTCHIDVRSCFLRELKEAGIIKVNWIAGSENDSDIHTKNLDGPLFEKFAQVYSGHDEYTPKDPE